MKTTIATIIVLWYSLWIVLGHLHAQDYIIQNGNDISTQLWFIAQEQQRANRAAEQQAAKQFACQTCINNELSFGVDLQSAMFLCQSQCQ